MTLGEMLAKWVAGKMSDEDFMNIAPRRVTCSKCGWDAPSDPCYRCEAPTHLVAAKMSEPTLAVCGIPLSAMSYCLTCHVFHIGDCPNGVGQTGTFPTFIPTNPYTTVDTSPQHTPREIEQGKKLGRAIGRMG